MFHVLRGSFCVFLAALLPVLVLIPRGAIATFDPGNMEEEIFERVGAIDLPAGEGFLTSAVMAPDGLHAYFGSSSDPGPPRIVKVNLETFERVGAVSFAVGENAPSSAVITPDGRYAYFGTANSPGRVVKIDLETFARVGAITLETNENRLISAVISPDGTTAYFGTETQPGRIVKVDLTTFERAGAIILPTGQDFLRSAVIASDGSFAIFGSGNSSGVAVKITTEPFAHAGSVTMTAWEPNLASAVITRDDQTVLFTSGFPTSARVSRVSTDPLQRTGETLLTSEDVLGGSIVISPDGVRGYIGNQEGTSEGPPGRVIKLNLTTFQRMGHITLEAGERELGCALMAPDGYHVYYGTRATPAKVIKVQVSPIREIPEEAREVGDFNDDGKTDMQDFLFLLENWGVIYSKRPVGFPDFMALLQNWG